MDPTTTKQWLMGTEAFEKRMPHHDGMKALWETKWKFPCTKSVYPFHDGKFEDFEPIFLSLIENNINDGTSPTYTQSFFPTATHLEAQGDTALLANDKVQASSYYLRAACVLRIARFPYITSTGPEGVNDAVKWEAWTRQKTVYLKAGELWGRAVQEVEVPFLGRKEGEGAGIPVYVRTPAGGVTNGDEEGNGEVNGSGEGRGKGFPTVILMTGLDGYRPDNTVRCDEFLSRGWASITVEIPGTADCPADPADPKAPDRLWDSIFHFMESDSRFNPSKVMVWGLSSGGYYAVRIAHTHKDRLVGIVAQGAGVHYFFDKNWLARIEGHEYPFGVMGPLAMKYGFGEDVEGYVHGAQERFSLLRDGTIDGGSARLLLINGTLDGLMPIEDSIMLMEYGTPKEARFFQGALHMGYPAANSAVYPWMESVMTTTSTTGKV